MKGKYTLYNPRTFKRGSEERSEMTPQIQLLTMEDVETIRKQIRVGDNLVMSTRILQLADSYEYAQQQFFQLQTEVKRLTKEREEMKDAVDAAIQCVGDYKRLKEEVERLSGLYRTACAILKMTYSDSDIERLKNVLKVQKGEVK